MSDPVGDDVLASVHQTVVAELLALLERPGDLAAFASQPDETLDVLVRAACAARSVDPGDYVQFLGQSAEARAQLQSTAEKVMTAPAAGVARRQGRLRQLEWNLHILRFLYTGTEPPPWVWERLDPSQHAQVRAQAGEQEAEPGAVAKIEQALLKLAQDPQSFGRCEGCGAEIPLGRLDLVPFAERCTDCQRRVEPPPKDSSAPNVEVLHFE